MRAVQFPVTVTVSYGGGAYVTQTVGGKRASSTMSAQCAAERLAEKLLPKPLNYTCTAVVVPFSRQVPGVTLWQIAKVAP